jgi:hypothetical protein
MPAVDLDPLIAAHQARMREGASLSERWQHHRLKWNAALIENYAEPRPNSSPDYVLLVVP